MTTPLIQLVHAPRGEDDPALAAVHAIAAIRSADAFVLSGHDVVACTADTRFGWLTHGRMVGARCLVASLPGDGVVGFAQLRLPLTEHLDFGGLDLVVHPLHRRRGVGSALLRASEQEAQVRRRSQLLAWSQHVQAAPGAGAPTPPAGRIARTDAAARFALANGYRLEQVESQEMLRLPVAADRLTELLDDATRAAGTDYAVHTWEGQTPPQWREDIACLTQQASTDTPSGETTLCATQWDGDKVACRGVYNEVICGIAWLYSAVEHLPSGRLVGYTAVERSTVRTHGVLQENTVVAPEHRGRHLGILLKATSLRLAARRWPDSPCVRTSHAEEDSYLRAINEELGFAPAGAFRGWLRVLNAS